MAGVQFSRRVLARTIASKLVAEPERQTHWLRTLAAYLVEQNRRGEADLIIHDIEHELYEQDKHLLVHVTAARPLTADVRTALKKLLKEQTAAREVTLTEQTDPSLVGGLVARSADAQLDTSVRAKLNRLATIT